MGNNKIISIDYFFYKQVVSKRRSLIYSYFYRTDKSESLYLYAWEDDKSNTNETLGYNSILNNSSINDHLKWQEHSSYVKTL